MCADSLCVGTNRHCVVKLGYIVLLCVVCVSVMLVWQGRGTDSANVTGVSGTQSSDYCAISLSPPPILHPSFLFLLLLFLSICHLTFFSIITIFLLSLFVSSSSVSSFRSLHILSRFSPQLAPPPFLSFPPSLRLRRPTQTSMNYSDCVALQVFPISAPVPSLFSSLFAFAPLQHPSFFPSFQRLFDHVLVSSSLEPVYDSYFR